jgi:Zinc-binding dehydrogenase
MAAVPRRWSAGATSSVRWGGWAMRGMSPKLRYSSHPTRPSISPAPSWPSMAGSQSTASEVVLSPTHHRNCLGTGGNIEMPDWDAKVRELTAGRGVDCVVEIGGRETIAMSLKALAVSGHVSLIGASLSQSGAGLDPLFLPGRGLTLGSIHLARPRQNRPGQSGLQLYPSRVVIPANCVQPDARALDNTDIGNRFPAPWARPRPSPDRRRASGTESS